jgi:hypothetical protein
VSVGPEPITVDDTQWPLVVYTFDGDQTDGDIESFLARVGEIHARREPFVTITVIRRYVPNFAHVTRVSLWMKDEREVLRRWCQANAVVTVSAAFRFIISAYRMLANPPNAIVVFDSLPAAEVWMAQRMKQDGLPVPARLREMA